MSPRRSAAEAHRTRAAIVECVIDRASIDGLEGVTIGRLAADLGMSKSGVLGPFGTKEQLQLSAIEAASAVFRREVWGQAVDAHPGLDRILAICDAWISFLERDVFPGGCFITAASCEVDGHPGRVRDAVATSLAWWIEALRHEAQLAVDAGELPADRDPEMIAFQLNAIAMGANQAIQLLDDDSAPHRARRAMYAALGIAG